MGARTIVITGASDGIGAAAAKRLSKDGNTVVVVGRSPEKTEKVAADIGADYHLADFGRLEQVRELAETLRSRYPRIDVLANNAGGVMGAEREVTVDGHEKTFQVNHLAPFLLTNLLMDTLVESRASVLNTSSIANRLFSRFDIDDLEARKRYKVNAVYGNAKLANILFTNELDRRYHDQGISTVAFHPGNVASNFGAETGSIARFVYLTPLRHVFLVSTDKGADPLVHFATTQPGVDWQSGRYYAKTRTGFPHRKAKDPDLAQQLWERSAQMVGLPASP